MHPSKKLGSDAHTFEFKDVSMTSIPKATPNHITYRTKEKSFLILEKSSKGILIDACSLHVLGFKTLPKDQCLNVLSWVNMYAISLSYIQLAYIELRAT